MFLLVCVILIMFPDKSAQGAREGIEVALKTVVPAILPFFIVAQGMLFTGFCPWATKVCAPFLKRVKLNAKCAAPFVTALLAGYPVGCKMVCEMYKENMITKEEGEEFLSFCNNGGVIFALSVCGVSVFGSITSGIIIFTVQIIASLITGRILSRKRDGEEVFIDTEKLPYLASLGKAVSAGGGIILNIISSFVVFYAIINAFNLDKVPLLCGIAEMTKGVMWAGKMNNVPLAAMYFSFGGLAVFSQCTAIMADTDLKLGKMIVGKILTAILSFSITWVILYIMGIC